MKKPDYRSAKILLVAITSVGLMIMVSFGERHPAAIAIGVAVMLAGVIVDGLLWRCPKCGHGLPGRGGKILFCPHCGEKLE